MILFIALPSLALALILLMALSIIDLKHMLLPDKLVLPFLMAGFAFNISTSFWFVTPADMALGALLGGGLLYAVRFAANAYYKQDALGLGDVKLLTAAGIWLGMEGVLIAIIAGATAGIAHGLATALLSAGKNGTPVNLKTFSLPAGPGFAIGIVLAGIIKFWNLPLLL